MPSFYDRIVFSPSDVDLSLSPLKDLGEETFILGAFNPGLTRLPNGNLLLMVRIAESLREPARDGFIRSVRWRGERSFTVDLHPLEETDTRDPREIHFPGLPSKVLALTSLSWLLPVEIAPGGEIIAAHYDKAIIPQASYQEYGVEDPRISRIGDTWYMTACTASAERHCTTLYTSADGLNYTLQGIVLDHQNKDMVFFEGMPQGKFHALTRPLGDLYFAYPPGSEFLPGPSINLATSPDALHWKPHDGPLIRPRRDSPSAAKVGGGAPPVLTPAGWLVLYHGVQPGGDVGIYRTFWALLDRDEPSRILRLEDREPLLEARPEISAHLDDLKYLRHVVFTTGIVEEDDCYLMASGEDDLACRLTRLSKKLFH